MGEHTNFCVGAQDDLEICSQFVTVDGEEEGESKAPREIEFPSEKLWRKTWGEKVKRINNTEKKLTDRKTGPSGTGNLWLKRKVTHF